MQPESNDLGHQIDEIQNQLNELLAKNEKSVANKPLGKYHDIYLLLIGFALTALVGGFISHFYQKKMYDYQKQAINYENQQTEITEFYKRVSDIITTRYLYARRLITSIEEEQDDYLVAEAKQKYYLSIDEWSKSDAYNRAFIQSTFPTSVFKAYVAVSDNFTLRLHPSLRTNLKYKDNKEAIEATNHLITEQDIKDRAFFTECSKYVFSKK